MNLEIPYKRRLEELKRCPLRVQKLYDWQIISEIWEDSFASPKDLILNFFRVSYELKDNLKNKKWFEWHSWLVESFYNDNDNDLLLISLDIANIKKHWKHWKQDRKPRTNKKIGEINTHLHIFDPNWKNKTELTIDIDWEKQDCLEMYSNVYKLWDSFFVLNKI